MSEKPIQVTGDDSELRLSWFKERVTAFIGIGIFLVAGILSLAAAYTAATGENGFSNMKDLLTFWSGLVGATGGYYFGRIGVEKRAETAESTVQLAQTAWSEAERQAAQAVAKLDVEEMAREALERGKELAEQGQEKAEQLVQVAQEARQQAETKIDHMGEVMTEVTQGMQTMRERVQTFKEKLGAVGAAAADLGSLVLGAEEEGAAPLPLDVQELDEVTANIDALMFKMKQVQH
jgi:ribosomal protein L15